MARTVRFCLLRVFFCFAFCLLRVLCRDTTRRDSTAAHGRARANTWCKRRQHGVLPKFGQTLVSFWSAQPDIANTVDGRGGGDREAAWPLAIPTEKRAPPRVSLVLVSVAQWRARRSRCTISTFGRTHTRTASSTASSQLPPRTRWRSARRCRRRRRPPSCCSTRASTPSGPCP